MYTLKDVLIALRKFDVLPSEVPVPYEWLRYFIDKARKISRDEGENDDLMEDIDGESDDELTE